MTDTLVRSQCGCAWPNERPLYGSFIPLGAFESREDDTRFGLRLCGWFASGSHRVEYLGASSTALPPDQMAQGSCLWDCPQFRYHIDHYSSKTPVTGETLPIRMLWVVLHTNSNRPSGLIIRCHYTYFSLSLMESGPLWETPQQSQYLEPGREPQCPRMVTATTGRPAIDPSRPTPRWFARINFEQQPRVATIPA